MKQPNYLNTIIVCCILIFPLYVLAQEVQYDSSIVQQFDDDDTTSYVSNTHKDTDNIEHEVTTVSSSEIQTPLWVINKSNDFIIQKVGKTYFDDHIRISSVNTRTGKYSEKYVITYLYLHEVTHHVHEIPEQIRYQIKLRLNQDGDLVEYRGIAYPGPKMPYEFQLTEDNVTSIANDYGLLQPYDIQLYFGENGYGSDEPIEDGTYLWVAASKQCVAGNNVYLIFVDVDSGVILGTKSRNTTCQGLMLSENNSSSAINDSISNISDNLKNETGDGNNTGSDTNTNITNSSTEDNIVIIDKGQVKHEGFFEKIIRWFLGGFGK